MDKAILKKFAIESRQDLMDKIGSKIKSFYIEEDFTNEQKGEIYILSNETHTLSLTNDEFKKRELLIKRIKELSLEQVIEEAAYTWFNRIIAIRYMEVNDMLPLTSDNQSLGIRVLSSKDNTPDPEILKFSNLLNPDLDIDFKKEKYVELKDDNEKFKYILLLICKKLGRVIPQVFDGVTDYIDILIPDNLLNDTGFITKVVNEVPEENYNQVEIIGWLYQYYISEKKDEVFADLKKNIKINKENIPSATQIFTPDWIVKYMVDNTLGRYTSKEFQKTLKYYVETDGTEDEETDIKNVCFLDPCCGSGHILVYAFELFYKIYLNQGYNKKDIPELILKNNLFGLDVDDRAGQLSILSILLKAREIDKNIFNKSVIKNINIMSIQESNNISKNCFEYLNTEENKNKAMALYDIFFNAKEIGSLLLVNDDNYDCLEKNIKENNTIFGIELKKMLPLIKANRILSKKYSVVVTNPPYMGNKGMTEQLYKFATKNYSDSKIDLFSMFIKRCGELCCENGYYALITPPSVLFLGSFEKLRKKIIKEKTIYSLLHMGRGIFGIDFGSTSFVIKNSIEKNFLGKYFRLHERNFQLIEIEDIEKIFLNAKNNSEYKFDFFNYPNKSTDDSYKRRILYVNNQNNFIKIPGVPISYWITEKEFLLFLKYKKIGDIFEARGGMTTGNNNLFLRYWYEINNKKFVCNLSKEEAILSDYKWFPYNKGGDYRKWYGNMNFVIDWYKDGIDIKKYKLDQRKNNANYNIAIAGLSSMFHPQVSWSLVSAGNFGVRLYPKGFLFDVAGSAVLPDDENEKYVLAYLNSKVADRYLKAFNPTINYQPGDIKSLVFIEKEKNVVDNLSQECISISKKDWDSFETSWDFKKHPLISEATLTPQRIKKEQDTGFQVCNNLEEAYNHWRDKTKKRFNELKKNEEELNDIFIGIYGLEDELSKDVEDKDITIRLADKERDIKSLISYAVGCMFGRYSLDKDGLVYAGGDFDNVYQKYKKADGGTAGSSLSNYKYLNDNGNEIKLSFEVDNDNIIPITDEAYFSDDIVERFKTFIKTIYGDNTFNENMDFIAEALCKKGTETSEETIRRYFVNDFFNDHVKMYQKRPIYWLLDSGKKNGFKALVYMHRYNENLIPKARLDYLHRVQTTYEKLLSDVNYRLTTELSMTDKKETKNRQTDLMAKLQEIKEYDEKIAHIANQRISIDLDDGVKVNYDKFKDILAKIK